MKHFILTFALLAACIAGAIAQDTTLTIKVMPQEIYFDQAEELAGEYNLTYEDGYFGKVVHSVDEFCVVQHYMMSSGYFMNLESEVPDDFMESPAPLQQENCCVVVETVVKSLSINNYGGIVKIVPGSDAIELEPGIYWMVEHWSDRSIRTWKNIVIPK